MKIVFLNICHGTYKPELISFIEQESSTTDIFCFQEADPASRHYLRQILSEFTEYSQDKIDPANDHAQFNQATYVNKGTLITRTYALLEQTDDTGLAIVTNVQRGDEALTVANVHGISFMADDKLDTEGRLAQSRTIIEALQNVPNPVIVGGDFNLLPAAESIQMFQEAGYENLIATYQISTTRNRLAWERYPDNPQYYADYAFTSHDIQIRGFAVPQNEVSDHLPLILELDLIRTDVPPLAPILADSTRS